MISGEDFKNLCDWNLCNRYKIELDINNIQQNDFVFINTGSIFSFINLMSNQNIDKKLNLVLHNSDISFDQDMYEKLERFATHIFSINSVISNEKITKIPIGFSDKLVKLIHKVDNKVNTKTNLAYMNFLIQTNTKERSKCFDTFKNKEWVYKGKYLGHDNVESQLFFWEELKSSKYCICPVGTGLDTHRFWESLYFDVIPIVKNNLLSDLYEKLPCIIVDEWNDTTYEYLENNYTKYLNKLQHWKETNRDWLLSKYWIRKN